MNTWALIVAAGRGVRLGDSGGGLPKQFLPVESEPLFWRSALAFARVPALRGIVFVLPSEWPVISAESPPAYIPETLLRYEGSPHDHEALRAAYEALLQGLDGQGRLGLPWRVVLGGERRQDSVANGLAGLPTDCDAVLVHDGARPFVSPFLINRVLDALQTGPCAIPGLSVSDTVKQVDEEGRAVTTLDRSRLRTVQTPQGFSLPVLRKAHAMARREGWEVTDDASLLERCNIPVQIVEGEESNRKITHPEDLELLRSFSASIHSGSVASPLPQMIPCSGFGYDVHRYGGNRPFILGGVPVACDVRVAAHSDGDTLLHALMDAMLGCIGAGDIGLLFPDSDPALDNIPSGILLSEVLERCRTAGLVITHVDVTVIAQIPRIAPHRQAIAANLAKLLQLPGQAVNVKATTEEGLGFTGEKKGIKVAALVSGLRPGDRFSR